MKIGVICKKGFQDEQSKWYWVNDDGNFGKKSIRWTYVLEMLKTKKVDEMEAKISKSQDVKKKKYSGWMIF